MLSTTTYFEACSKIKFSLHFADQNANCTLLRLLTCGCLIPWRRPAFPSDDSPEMVSPSRLLSYSLFIKNLKYTFPAYFVTTAKDL